jgi:eukaryotic-like serine/threonine-protein kinase
MVDAQLRGVCVLGTNIGNYAVTATIGEGGMGSVYLAEHAMLGRRAAVKVLRPELSTNSDVVGRFFNEARALSALRHPSIVEILDYGNLPDGSAYIVMEYLDGESLGARCRRLRKLDPRHALMLVRQIAGALAAAHERGIVHRDLKPENIFLVPDPEIAGGERIKVLDFGIAKLAAPGNRARTQTGSMLGTPAYMSPEQCRGAGNVDARADLYALGCVLFEMLCGQPPFTAEGMGEVIAHHLYFPPPAPRSLDPTLPEGVEQLVLRLLQKDPAARPQSAREVVDAIDRLGAAASAMHAGAMHASAMSAPTIPVPTPPGAMSAPTISVPTPPGAMSAPTIPVPTPPGAMSAPTIPVPTPPGAMSAPTIPVPTPPGAWASAAMPAPAGAVSAPTIPGPPTPAGAWAGAAMPAPAGAMPMGAGAMPMGPRGVTATPPVAAPVVPYPETASGLPRGSMPPQITTLSGAAGSSRHALQTQRPRARPRWFVPVAAASLVGLGAAIAIVVGRLERANRTRAAESSASSASVTATLDSPPNDTAPPSDPPTAATKPSDPPTAATKPSDPPIAATEPSDPPTGAAKAPDAIPARASEPPAAGPAAAPVAARVTFAIDSVPPGASVLVDGKAIGTTPFDESIERAAGQRVYTLQKAGYEPATVTLARDRNGSQRVTLKKKRPSRGSADGVGDKGVNPFD